MYVLLCLLLVNLLHASQGELLLRDTLVNNSVIWSSINSRVNLTFHVLSCQPINVTVDDVNMTQIFISNSSGPEYRIDAMITTVTEKHFKRYKLLVSNKMETEGSLQIVLTLKSKDISPRMIRGLMFALFGSLVLVLTLVSALVYNLVMRKVKGGNLTLETTTSRRSESCRL
ncbi:uncharacterized protein LOC131947828 [Physella acuta]|uniref:uncharacterized protein LOC131947828 n=1 Tax=Physella acuta TaxID=109671 RepID=UPI0027DCCF3F|nr:uncharacterized protein LOC131947828 [Physella acuta]